MPPPRYVFPWWAYILVLAGMLATAFLVYAIKRLVGMKRTFRSVQ